jgi:hypothetical protein
MSNLSSQARTKDNIIRILTSIINKVDHGFNYNQSDVYSDGYDDYGLICYVTCYNGEEMALEDIYINKMIARFKKMIRVLERGIYMGKNCVFLDPNSTLLFNILTTRTSINLQHSDINFTSRQKYRESCDLNSICRIIANKIYSHKKYKYTIYSRILNFKYVLIQVF